jgi:lysophospholipase L1-like esterase
MPFIIKGQSGSDGLLPAASIPSVLDWVTGATMAYSTTRLATAYTGAALRVRRSSDNTEMDIGFNTAGKLNPTTLSNFCGTGDGFVSTWYDQSGNGLHVTAPSNSLQPKIVSSGIIQQANGFASLRFDGSWLKRATGFPSTAWTKVILHKPLDVGVPNNIFSATSSLGHIIFTDNTINWKPMVEGQIFSEFKGYSIAGKTEVLVQDYNSASKTLNLYRNGVKTISQTGSNTYTGNVTYGFGAYNGNYFYRGDVLGIIAYPVVLSAGQIKNITNAMLAMAALSARTFVFDGDSLTEGGVTGSSALSYPYQFGNLLSLPCTTLYNDGTGGQTLLQMDTSAASTSSTATEAAGIDSLSYLSGARKTLVVWGGSNDFPAGASVTTTYQRLKTYLANRKASGLWHDVVVLTAIPRVSITSTLFQYNDAIRAGWNNGTGELATTYGVTHLCDLQQLAMFNADADTSNTTYYNADQIHLTATGNQQVALAVKNCLGL